jgi:fructuronate reductase
MATLAAASVPLVPPYERSFVQNITHLGVGAFARAHLGVYADDLNRRGWPALLRGISLMSDRAEREMGPQDGLYTVAEREPGEEVALRVVGSITAVRTPPSRPSPHRPPTW